MELGSCRDQLNVTHTHTHTPTEQKAGICQECASHVHTLSMLHARVQVDALTLPNRNAFPVARRHTCAREDQIVSQARWRELTWLKAVLVYFSFKHTHTYTHS